MEHFLADLELILVHICISWRCLHTSYSFKTSLLYAQITVLYQEYIDQAMYKLSQP